MAKGWAMSTTGLSNARTLLDKVRTEWSGDTLYLVGPSVEYAIHHEFGTSKMEARPFMRPAIERVMSAPVHHASQYVDGSVDNERQLVAGVALAIEAEAKKIVKQKDIWQDGNLHGSIEARRVS